MNRSSILIISFYFLIISIGILFGFLGYKIYNPKYLDFLTSRVTLYSLWEGSGEDGVIYESNNIRIDSAGQSVVFAILRLGLTVIIIIIIIFLWLLPLVAAIFLLLIFLVMVSELLSGNNNELKKKFENTFGGFGVIYVFLIIFGFSGIYSSCKYWQHPNLISATVLGNSFYFDSTLDSNNQIITTNDSITKDVDPNEVNANGITFDFDKHIRKGSVLLQISEYQNYQTFGNKYPKELTFGWTVRWKNDSVTVLPKTGLIYNTTYTITIINRSFDGFKRPMATITFSTQTR